MGDIREAPNPQAAVEMVLIRLAYAADLPDPADLIKKLKNAPADTAPSGIAMQAPIPSRQPEPVAVRRVASGGGGDYMEPQGSAQASAEHYPAEKLQSMQDIYMLLNDAREMVLAAQVFYNVHPVKLEAGRIEVRMEPDAPTDLAQNLRKFLIARTGQQWFVTVVSAAGLPTLAQLQAEADARLMDEAKAHPTVKAVLETFPGAVLKLIKSNDRG
jgi:DNA polymerase-3 subunit gamma/tau